MAPQQPINIQVNPTITPDALFDFYERNNICEVGFGKKVAARILEHPHLIVAAYLETELIGLARATFDGLSAHIMEFSIDIRYQGDNLKYNNGSLIESDNSRLGFCWVNTYAVNLKKWEQPSSQATSLKITKSPFIAQLVSRKTKGIWSITLTHVLM